MSIGAWQPLWIGDDSRQLYAALHPAAQARVGILMAPPLLHEQPRSRRVLAEIASYVAELGLPCLRFDWFGTGDSTGTGMQHDVAAMHADLAVAAQALRVQSAVERVVVLAWRGAALATCTWGGARDGVAALALWEPIVDGAAWLAALDESDRAERRYRYGAGQGTAHDGYLMGFPTSQAWRSGIARARVAAPLPVPLWTVARATSVDPLLVQRRFELPPDAPRFDDGIGIENAMFLSRKLFGVVDEFGRAALDA